MRVDVLVVGSLRTRALQYREELEARYDCPYVRGQITRLRGELYLEVRITTTRQHSRTVNLRTWDEMRERMPLEQADDQVIGMLLRALCYDAMVRYVPRLRDSEAITLTREST